MTHVLTDIGANLAHDSFDDDRDAVLQRAAAAGVSRIVVTGSSFDSNSGAAALAVAHPGQLYATAGVHPHHAADYDDAVDDQIRTLIAQPGVVAVGECGLDYFRNFSPRDAQIAAFKAQLDIAVESLHGGARIPARIPRNGPVDRDNRLDLRRAARYAPQGNRRRRSGRATVNRDRRALPVAAHDPPEAEITTQ